MRIFRHHRCSICQLPRPFWMRGDHTSCTRYKLELMRREELRRLKEPPPRTGRSTDIP